MQQCSLWRRTGVREASSCFYPLTINPVTILFWLCLLIFVCLFWVINLVKLLKMTSLNIFFTNPKILHYQNILWWIIGRPTLKLFWLPSASSLVADVDLNRVCCLNPQPANRKPKRRSWRRGGSVGSRFPPPDRHQTSLKVTGWLRWDGGCGAQVALVYDLETSAFIKGTVHLNFRNRFPLPCWWGEEPFSDKEPDNSSFHQVSQKETSSC